MSDVPEAMMMMSLKPRFQTGQRMTSAHLPRADDFKIAPNKGYFNKPSLLNGLRKGVLGVGGGERSFAQHVIICKLISTCIVIWFLSFYKRKY